MLLDFFCIFSTGGLILWHKKFVNSKFETLINYLIKTVLLDQKRNQDSLLVSGTMIRWKIADEKNLIFVVAYQEAYSLLYVEKLITMVMNDFIKKEYDQLVIKNNLIIEEFDYTKRFMSILSQWESDCNKIMTGGTNTQNADNLFKKQKSITKKEGKDNQIKPIDTKQEDEPKRESSHGPITSKQSNSNIPKNIQAKRSSKSVKPEEKKEKEDKKPPVKQKTKKDNFGVYDEKDAKELDQSKKPDSSSTPIDQELSNKAKYIDESEPEEIFDDNDFTASEDEAEEKPSSGIFSRFSSGLKNFMGNKVLEEKDLQPIMKIFVEGLMDKNVAKDIAEDVCASVTKSLLKTKTASFTTIKATAKQALKDAISKILTPKQDLDILKNALAAKGRGDPYKVVFIGVNGVGKSTNLAKVAYLLKNNGLNLLIAACDNFRSGAIEQLKTHSRALDVEIFEKGYKDDIAYIAKEAIEDAKRRKKDVVLIDTAGRMQDNEPLMRSLAKLIEVNQPDLILFVGEALTGNDSVDQLTKFNQSLIDFSKRDPPRVIDGILLTKFDTVDDKVGAALTMVYTTGKPIVYVGVGQKYTNLKKLNVNNVLNALFN